jgi:hypothetical protein
MAYIYVDPTAAGDANFILANGECYRRVKENYSISPNVSSATSISSCTCSPPCNPDPCTNCTATYNWSVSGFAGDCSPLNSSGTATFYLLDGECEFASPADWPGPTWFTSDCFNGLWRHVVTDLSLYFGTRAMVVQCPVRMLLPWKVQEIRVPIRDKLGF